jgi:glycosyltransferase involved in cell wall biosynthesis
MIICSAATRQVAPELIGRPATVKILYHHRIRSKDGQAVHVAALIAALRALGHRVTVVEPAGFRDSAFGGSSPLISWLKRHLPQHLYEVLEISYNVPDYLRLVRACRRVKPDFIYERYNLFALAGIWVSRQAGIPLLLEVNAPLAQERAKFGRLGARRTAGWVESWTWRTASHVLPVTQILADLVTAAGVPAERITVIPNGVDLSNFSRADSGAAKLRLGLEAKTVMGFVGFIREWHGLDQVINLLARPDIPNSLHLLLVGDGPALSSLREQARRIGVTARVTFAGLVAHEKIVDHLAAFDIALQPKAVPYASPLKLFEYMALGKAIIAPDQSNLREVLIDGQNAVLYSGDVADSLADAVIRLARDVSLCRRIGDGARSTLVEKRMTWLDNAQRITAIGTTLRAAQRAARRPAPTIRTHKTE